MSDYKNTYQPTVVSPPGDTLLELLEDRGMSQADLARRMGRPKKTINEIVKAKAAITPGTALELELVFGIPAAFWNSRESHYREYVARAELMQELGAYLPWARQFPVRDMQALGWVDECPSGPERVQALLQFFGVAAPEQWDRLATEQSATFRTPRAFASEEHAVSAWLRQGWIGAQAISCSRYNARAFKECLVEIRGLTAGAFDKARERAVDLCASAGVAVVFTPELRRVRASGATQWMTPSKVILQLSIRYRTEDQLWFTLFHEAGHILLHRKDLIFIEASGASTAVQNGAEAEADEFAANFLIPPNEYALLVSGNLGAREILKVAKRIGIGAGVVVGRLQHDGLIPFNRFNHLKGRLRWEKVHQGFSD